MQCCSATGMNCWNFITQLTEPVMMTRIFSRWIRWRTLCTCPCRMTFHLSLICGWTCMNISQLTVRICQSGICCMWRMCIRIIRKIWIFMERKLWNCRHRGLWSSTTARQNSRTGKNWNCRSSFQFRMQTRLWNWRQSC